MYGIFSRHYLRQPMSKDVARITAENARRLLPRMFGSIDCMHWDWKNYPTTWAKQY